MSFVGSAVFGVGAAFVLYGTLALGGAGVLWALGVGIYLLLLVVVSVLLARRDARAFLVFWVTTALTQNLFVGIWLASGQPGGLLWTEAKSISAVAAAVALSPRIGSLLRRQPTVLFAFCAYGLAGLASVRWISPGAVAYGRNFALPLVLALLAYALVQGIDLRTRARWVYQISALAIAFLALGNLLEIFVGTLRWRSVLNADSLGSVSALSTDTPVLGMSVGRAGGFLLEPVTTGYVATGAVIALLVAVQVRSELFPKKPRSPWSACLMKWQTWAILGGLVIASSGTKSSGLTLMAAFIMYVAARKLRPSRTGFAVVGVWAMSVLSVFLYMTIAKPSVLRYGLSDPLQIIGGDSTTYHWAGLVLGLRGSWSPPWGAGLGDGGNFYYNFHPDAPKLPAEWLGSGSESGIGVLAHQLGLIGLVAFAVLIVALASRWGAASAVMLVAWSAGALFGESYFGPLVAWAFVVPAGLLALQEGEEMAALPQAAVLAYIRGGWLRMRKSLAAR